MYKSHCPSLDFRLVIQIIKMLYLGKAVIICDTKLTHHEKGNTAHMCFCYNADKFWTNHTKSTKSRAGNAPTNLLSERWNEGDFWREV